jgi:NCS2 family nucleobase:cation symporter-2/xanthine permease XanP
MVGKSNKILYAVDENPPLWLTLLMGLQHVLLIYSSIVFLPVIIGKAAGAPLDHILFASFAAGVASGLVTLIQVLRLGAIGTGYTLFMGSSAAYLAGSIATLKAGGFPLLATLSILVAPVEFLMAYFLRFLRHIITPVVGGVILLLVVLSLVPLSLHEWTGEKGQAFYGSWENFLAGLITLCVLLGLSLFGNKNQRVWSPILGLAAGLAAAWSFGLFQAPKATMDFPWLGSFRGTWPGLTLDLSLEHLPVLGAMALLTMINGVQAIGNSMAIQQIAHRRPRPIDYGVVQGTMYADALGNVFSGIMGTVPNETYSENISVQKVTGVASRSVGVCGALLLIALPFSPKISLFLVNLPTPVFGGFLMGLAAMMLPTGLELVFAHGINHRTGLLVGVSVCIGLVAESGKFFTDLFPVSLGVFLNNGVAAGGLVVIILSLLFRLTESRGYSAKVPSGPENLPFLAEHVQKAGEILDLAAEQTMRLELACEEIFLHIARTGGDITMGLRIKTVEEELLVEIIYGRGLGDLAQIKMPGNLLAVPEADLDNLGLALLHQLVHDFHQAVISGITYIWFRME